jgi:hypothetical protein
MKLNHRTKLIGVLCEGQGMQQNVIIGPTGSAEPAGPPPGRQAPGEYVGELAVLLPRAEPGITPRHSGPSEPASTDTTGGDMQWSSE